MKRCVRWFSVFGIAILALAAAGGPASSRGSVDGAIDGFNGIPPAEVTVQFFDGVNGDILATAGAYKIRFSSGSCEGYQEFMGNETAPGVFEHDDVYDTARVVTLGEGGGR